MTLASVTTAYGARADEYIDAVGRIEHVADADLALITEWAGSLNGPLLDVGCGPGQWTHWLGSRGVVVEGIDPTSEFVERARAAYPGETYRVGRAESLNVEPGSLGGVLAWYSLIHTRPDDIDEALDEFARCIRPGGGLLLGFFTAAEQASFDHAIATAFTWPVELLAGRVEAAGFTVSGTDTRAERPDRTHGSITAVRR